MGAKSNTSKRSLLLVTIMFIGTSLFLCGAGFFFWLSTGANTEKVPPAMRPFMQKVTEIATRRIYPTANVPENTTVTHPPNTTLPEEIATGETNSVTACAVGFTFDPILGICIENVPISPTVIISPIPTDSSQTCSVGFVFDPLLNACVQAEISGNSTPEPESQSGNVNCTIGFTFDPVLGACVEIKIQESTEIIEVTATAEIELPDATEIIPAIEEVELPLAAVPEPPTLP